MADRYLIVDDTTGKYKRGAAYNDTDTYFYDDFDVTVGTQTTFILARTFTSMQLLDVLVNGEMRREGASYDFTRNVGAHSITFNYPIAATAWVRTKLLNPGALISPSTEDFDTVTPITDFTSANAFSNGSNIEVYRNGTLMREGATKDFQRNTGMQKIIFNSAVPTSAWVRIRIY